MVYSNKNNNNNNNNKVADVKEDCFPGPICVGPDVSYAIGHQIGVVIESEYVVPSLPEQFDSTQQVFHGYL
jgi:hypothetical protein